MGRDFEWGGDTFLGLGKVVVGDDLDLLEERLSVYGF